jgi:hypothetical protein
VKINDFGAGHFPNNILMQNLRKKFIEEIAEKVRAVGEFV